MEVRPKLHTMDGDGVKEWEPAHSPEYTDRFGKPLTRTETRGPSCPSGEKQVPTSLCWTAHLGTGLLLPPGGHLLPCSLVATPVAAFL